MQLAAEDRHVLVIGNPGHVEVLSGLSAGTRVALHSADDGQSEESADDE